jgi:hypothetical protein
VLTDISRHQYSIAARSQVEVIDDEVNTLGAQDITVFGGELRLSGLMCSFTVASMLGPRAAVGAMPSVSSNRN